MKLPEKGELVLVFDESGNDSQYEEYRKDVLKRGGRLRRAVGEGAFLRHLAVYSPTFIVHLKRGDLTGG